MTVSGQGEYAVVTQAEGSLVKTDGEPDPSMIPSLLALSDVMPTGLARRRVARESPKVAPRSSSATAPSGSVGCSRPR